MTFYEVFIMTYNAGILDLFLFAIIYGDFYNCETHFHILDHCQKMKLNSSSFIRAG